MPLFTWVHLLSGGFEGSLAGWSVGNGGDTPTWQTYAYGTLPYEPEGAGSHYAVCDARTPGLYADTLLSPAIPVSGYDSLRLTYSYAFNRVGPTSSDSAVVMVRYYDGSTWGPWASLRRYEATGRGWDTLPLLTGYDSVQVALAYYSQEGAYWFAIDEVSVEGRRLLSTDVEATAILLPEALHYRGEYISPTVRITNRGTTAVYTYAHFYVLYRGDTVYRGTADLTADTGAYYDVAFPWFIPESLGVYEAVAIVEAGGDEYAGNDTARKVFKVWPYPDIIFEVPFAPSVDLDGRASPGEWDSSYRIDASNYFGKASPPTDTGVVIVRLQHDGSHLNLLVQTGDTTYDSTDALYLFIDDDGDNRWEKGEGLNVLWGRPYSLWATMDSSEGYVFPRKDLALNFARLGGTFEVSIPISPSSDPGKLNRRVGEDVSLFVAYREGRSGKFWAWWPQTADLSPDTFGPANTHLTLQRPEGWRDVGILPLIRPCEAEKVCTTSIVIYDNRSLVVEVETLKVEILRDGTPVARFERFLNVTYGSTDTLHFRWLPPDSGHYTLLAHINPDMSPGNDSVLSYVPVGKPVSPPYVQDFEGRWPPVGWEVVGRGWVPGHYLGDARVSPTFGSSGSGFAEFLSFVLPSGDSSALHLPPIVASGSAHLSLKVWNGPTWAGRGNYDRIDIYYRRAGEGMWYLLGGVFGDIPLWREYSFNLPPADTLYLKLVARSDYGDTDVSIDDVSILPGMAVGEGNGTGVPCSVGDGKVEAPPGTPVKVYSADGRLLAEGRTDGKGVYSLHLRKGVFFIVCKGVVKRAVAPLK